jgi:hypothetical protein
MEESAKLAEFNNFCYTQAMRWNWQDFETEAIRREFQKITDIGTAVMDADDINRVG